MAETMRVASTPNAGALRDAVRTSIAIGLTMLMAKLVGEETAASLSGTIEAVVVVAISALFAWVGKTMRNKSNPIGTVV